MKTKSPAKKSGTTALTTKRPRKPAAVKRPSLSKEQARDARFNEREAAALDDVAGNRGLS